jgi:hypothetical protein
LTAHLARHIVAEIIRSGARLGSMTTAKAIGLTIPASFLSLADEVFE